MIPKLIVLQFIAHLLADYIFQPQRWSNLKSQKIVSAHHFYHVIVVFACTYTLSFDLNFWKPALALTILHFATDVFKSYLQIRAKRKGNENNYFFLDQSIHIVTLMIISICYIKTCDIDYIINIPYKITLIICGFVLLAKPTNICIKNIFIAFSIETPADNIITQDSEDRSLPNAGKLIGIMERFIVFSLILISQFAAVGLIIAAKSILRYKSAHKNEYILVGTLLSFGIATLFGILTTALLK